MLAGIDNDRILKILEKLAGIQRVNSSCEYMIGNQEKITRHSQTFQQNLIFECKRTL